MSLCLSLSLTRSESFWRTRCELWRDLWHAILPPVPHVLTDALGSHTQWNARMLLGSRSTVKRKCACQGLDHTTWNELLCQLVTMPRHPWQWSLHLVPWHSLFIYARLQRVASFKKLLISFCHVKRLWRENNSANDAIAFRECSETRYIVVNISSVCYFASCYWSVFDCFVSFYLFA